MHDELTIRRTGDYWLVELTYSTKDPQDVLNLTHALLLRHQVQSGTLGYSKTQEGEPSEDEVPRPSNTPIPPEPDEDYPPTPQSGVRPSLEEQYASLNRLNELFYQRRTPNGFPFEMKHWEEGIQRFCPDIDPKEAELERGEYLAERHNNTDEKE